MRTSMLLIISLLLLIRPAGAQERAVNVSSVPLTPDTVITPENIDSLHFERVPQPKRATAPVNLPQKSKTVAVTGTAGKRLTAYTSNGMFYIQEATPGHAPVRWTLHQLRAGETMHATFSPDGRFLIYHVYASDGAEGGDYAPDTYIWNVAAHRAVSFQHRDTNSYFDMMFVPGTQNLMTVDAGQFGEGRVNIWNIETGLRVNSFQFDTPAGYGETLLFNPVDNSTMVRVAGRFIEVIELATGDVSRIYYIDEDYDFSSATISADGTHLAVVTDESLYLVDLTTGDNPVNLYRESSKYMNAHAVGFSPDGRLLYMTGSTHLMVFETQTGKMLKTMTGERGFSQYMGIDDTGRYLLTWNEPDASENGWYLYRWSVDAE